MVLRGWFAIQVERIDSSNMAEWTTIVDKQNNRPLLLVQNKAKL